MEHVESKRVYIAVFAALMVLTAVTVSIAYVNLGRLNIVVALAIAMLKASLVVLFFMHVRHATRLMKVVVAGGVLWLAILIGLTMADYLTR
jgi:cytochrome c oxidase subunit IV